MTKAKTRVKRPRVIIVPPMVSSTAVNISSPGPSAPGGGTGKPMSFCVPCSMKVIPNAMRIRLKSCGDQRSRVVNMNSLRLRSAEYKARAPACLSGVDGKSKAQSLQDLGDGDELRVAIGRQRFVEIGPAKTGGLRDFRHALGARDVAKRCLQQFRVVVLEHRIEVTGDVLLRFQRVGGVPPVGLASHVVLNFCRQSLIEDSCDNGALKH